MSGKSFKGGIHPGYNKGKTESFPITSIPFPGKVVIPLLQHIGAPCEPLVEVGDEVKKGQKIAESEGFVSAPVHASIGGKVVSVGPDYTPVGSRVKSIVIEGNGSDEQAERLNPARKTLEELSGEEIVAIIREAGIVGMGGAAFPTHVKLSPPEGKKIDTVILNGAECEPYLTADHRIMLEDPESVVLGLKAVLKVLNAHTGVIGIEDNKPDAVKTLQETVKGEKNITVFPLPTKYPQGAEKMLMEVITGRQVPSGGLPLDVNVVNLNVGTSAAIAHAIVDGTPLIERVVTVSGSGIKKPSNLMVKIGTTFADVIEQCGGTVGKISKVISGGPMMGISLPTTAVPVIKGTSGILVLTDQEVQLGEIGPCIRCSRCIAACPMNLLPNFLGTVSEKRLFEEAEAFHALDCIECGCCAYVCPASRPLTQWIRVSKAEITARRRKSQ